MQFPHSSIAWIDFSSFAYGKGIYTRVHTGPGLGGPGGGGLWFVLRRAFAFYRDVVVILCVHPVRFLYEVCTVGMFFGVNVPITVAVFRHVAQVVEVRSMSRLPSVQRAVAVHVGREHAFVFKRTACLAKVYGSALFVEIGEGASFCVDAGRFEDIFRMGDFPYLRHLRRANVRHVPFERDDPNVFRCVVVNDFNVRGDRVKR